MGAPKAGFKTEISRHKEREVLGSKFRGSKSMHKGWKRTLEGQELME